MGDNARGISPRLAPNSKERKMPRLARFAVLTLAAAVVALAPASASAGLVDGFTEQVSPDDETNATEPYVAIDRVDGTVWVAWQASGSHVARSDDGGRPLLQTPIANLLRNF